MELCYIESMKTLFIVLSSALTLVSVIPYIWDVVRGRTKPRIVSWLTWALLTGIACAASFKAGQYAGAVLLLCATAETLSVVLAGLRYGDRTFARFDIVCQIAALAGLILWMIFHSPTIAIVTSVSVDLIGGLPTLKHTWQRPHEETWLTFFLGGSAAILTLMAADGWKITAIAYPLYLAFANMTFAAVILLRRKMAVPGQPSELRKL